MPPKFKNRENERVETRDGRQIWVSRACAVIAEVCMYNPADRQWYVLLAKRGSETPDCRGMWGLPCGYLDWDETLRDAVVREVWEECGLYLPELPQQPGFAGSSSGFFRTGEDSADTPWRIYDTRTIAGRTSVSTTPSLSSGTATPSPNSPTPTSAPAKPKPWTGSASSAP